MQYRITHSHGITERHDSYEEALSALRAVYGPDIETEGDEDDPHARVLVWRDAESARDDDGGRAVASIKPELDECAYCARIVANRSDVPAVYDDEAWDELAAEHAPDCEWVATRAHRVAESQ